MSPIVCMPWAELSIGITFSLCGKSSAIGSVNQTATLPLPIPFRLAIGFISPVEGILIPNVVLIIKTVANIVYLQVGVSR